MKVRNFGWIFLVLVMAIQATTAAALPLENTPSFQAITLVDPVDSEDEPTLLDAEAHTLTRYAAPDKPVTQPPTPFFCHPSPYNAQAPPVI